MSEYWVLKDKADNTYARLASSEVDVNFWDKDRTEAITFISSARANKEKGRGEYVSTVRVFRVFTKPKVVKGPHVTGDVSVNSEGRFVLDLKSTFSGVEYEHSHQIPRGVSMDLARMVLAVP